MTALVVAGIAATLLCVLLAAPVRVRLDVDTASAERPVRVAARWLAFAFTDIRPPATGRKPRRPRALSPSRSGGRALRALVSSPGAARRCLRLLRDLLRALGPRRAEALLRVGFDDPASTGRFAGLASAAAVPFGWRVQVEPDFTGPVLHVRAVLEWAVRPVALLRPLLSFAASPDVWRAVFAGLKASRRSDAGS